MKSKDNEMIQWLVYNIWMLLNFSNIFDEHNQD